MRFFRRCVDNVVTRAGKSLGVFVEAMQGVDALADDLIKQADLRAQAKTPPGIGAPSNNPNRLGVDHPLRSHYD